MAPLSPAAARVSLFDYRFAFFGVILTLSPLVPLCLLPVSTTVSLILDIEEQKYWFAHSCTFKYLNISRFWVPENFRIEHS